MHVQTGALACKEGTAPGSSTSCDVKLAGWLHRQLDHSKAVAAAQGANAAYAVHSLLVNNVACAQLQMHWQKSSPWPPQGGTVPQRAAGRCACC